jgi:hypothetical protein
MLQMLSVDFKKTGMNYPGFNSNSIYESDDEGSFHNPNNKRELVLPSLKIQNPLNLNISADLMKTDDENTDQDKIENKPKMYKIKNNYFFCFLLFLIFNCIISY